MEFADKTKVTEAAILRRQPHQFEEGDFLLIGKFLAQKEPRKWKRKTLRHCHWLYWEFAMNPDKGAGGLDISKDIALIAAELSARDTNWKFRMSLIVSCIALGIAVPGIYYAATSVEVARVTLETVKQDFDAERVEQTKQRELLERIEGNTSDIAPAPPTAMKPAAGTPGDDKTSSPDPK